MEEIKKQYEEIVSERNGLTQEIEELKNNDVIKKYFDLCNKDNQLEEKRKDLYKQIKVGEYSSCNHIWVKVLHDYDSAEGRSYDYHGCIKCGLDQRVFHIKEQYSAFDWFNCFTLEQEVMYVYMKDNSYHNGVYTGVLCDLELAKAIYLKIKEAHPSIDDETAKKYFEIALDNMRNIKVSDERKASRVKRLSLSPEFNKWTAWDVRK